jgi:hypothetical protein
MLAVVTRHCHELIENPRLLPPKTTPYRSAIATTNSSRTAMLTSLIDIAPAAHRRGANQMRQPLSVGEHFRRGNANAVLFDGGALSLELTGLSAEGVAALER